MMEMRSRYGWFVCLCFVILSLVGHAQPTLPDIVGSQEKGIVLISWTCQYDGVKSIAVLRSSDSNFNYSTIGFVKKLYKGVQGYADGHPLPGKNYYKLSIVFNSGLTWGSNHVGIYVDSLTALKDSRLPSNEQLQKMIVTESDKPQPTATAKVVNPQAGNKVAPADRDKYMEVIKKEKKDTVNRTQTNLAKQEIGKPKYTVDRNEVDKTVSGNYVQKIPQEMLDKIEVTYTDDTLDEDEEDDSVVGPQKLVNMTFNQKDDAAAFASTLPDDNKKKFTITYNDNSGATDRSPKDSLKNRVITARSNDELRTYLNTLPGDKNGKVTISYSVDSADLHTRAIKEQVIAEAPAPIRPKISLRFAEEEKVNAAADVRSKYIFNDAVSGHVTICLPDDIAAHHYSVKFYDEGGHVVIDVPRLNSARIILDKRNFQHKGQYRFALRRDVVELESGYINIY